MAPVSSSPMATMGREWRLPGGYQGRIRPADSAQPGEQQQDDNNGRHRSALLWGIRRCRSADPADPVQVALEFVGGAHIAAGLALGEWHWRRPRPESLVRRAGVGPGRSRVPGRRPGTDRQACAELDNPPVTSG